MYILENYFYFINHNIILFCALGLHFKELDFETQPKALKMFYMNREINLFFQF